METLPNFEQQKSKSAPIAGILEFCKGALERQRWRSIDRKYRNLPVGTSTNQHVSVEKYPSKGYVRMWSPAANLQGETNRLQEIEIKQDSKGAVVEICQKLTVHDTNNFPRIEISRCTRDSQDNSLQPKDVFWTLASVERLLGPNVLRPTEGSQ